MSQNIGYLHSHSGLERDMNFPKHKVLVDEDYGEMFANKQILKIKGNIYYKVDTYEFFKKGGVFKNLQK
jgi:hypothetical protein